MVKVLFPGDMARQASLSVEYYLYALLYPFNGPLNEMWFIATIMVFFALTPLWRIMLRNVYSEMLCLTVLLACSFINFKMALLSIDHVLQYAVYFYAGILVAKYGVADKLKDYKWVLVFIGAMAYACVRSMGGSFLGVLFAILASAGLAFILDKSLPKAFFSFRNYTYQIFLIGIFAQIAVKMLYKRVDMPYIAGYVLCILIGLYVPVMVSKVIERINWSPLLMCVGLKKK